MSRDAKVMLPFADGDYEFRLAWAELLMLQESRNCGPFVVLDRLTSGQWMIEDIAEVLRIGLIGGGIEPGKAVKMVRSYVQGFPPMLNLVFAQQVLGAALVGAADEIVGEPVAAKQGEDSASTTSQTVN